MASHSCLCRSLDRERFAEVVAEWSKEIPALPQLLAERPHLIAPVALLVPEADLQTIARLVAAIEALASRSAWQERALVDAPALAQRPYAPAGVFMGFDFHLTERGPQLIEINTNAGGAFINALIRLVQRGCCPELAAQLPQVGVEPSFAEQVVTIFRHEWQVAGRTKPLATIAIVDDEPAAQYLYPEFLLFRAAFAAAGIRALVSDARSLQWRAGRLWAVDSQRGEGGYSPVDLVYNRLTDFALAEPVHTALAAALAADGAVVTPHPRAHALFADKRRLVTLSDETALVALGVDAETRALLLAHVPTTVLVTDENAEVLWCDRRAFFFKPVAGYGSKAAYRGDKLTRRVWEQVIRPGQYVAQAYAAPGVRLVPEGEGGTRPLKFDLRAYAYRGEVLLFAARLYEGQTTNFRTQGGGFAPVFPV